MERPPSFGDLDQLTVVSSPTGGHVAPSEVMYPGGPGVDGGLLAPGDPVPENAGPGGRRPEWLKVRIGAGATFAATRQVIRAEALNTVCEEARCPNLGECWALGTATFMIMGSVCTRNCGFCAIDTGRPPITDWDEPRRVAEATHQMGLQHVVVTMVARDDLPDGGAGMVAETIRQIRLANPRTSVEVLISDLNGREADIRTVVEARPDILNHNVETVLRLHSAVRRRARWDRSVSVLTIGRAIADEIGFDEMVTKTGMRLGLGETWDEVLEAMRLLHAVEELNRVDGSVGITMWAHNSLCANHIVLFGSPEQKARYLPDLASGKRIASICITEPESGSHILGMRCTARREGDSYVLNGRKWFIANTHVADVHGVVARTSEGTGAEALARALGLRFYSLPIHDTFQAALGALAPAFSGRPSDITEENLQARIRGNILMALSNKFGWLVLTTGNKSEFSAGYTTLYGDMAGGFAVLKDVYKTMVYQLAQHRNRRDGDPPIPARTLSRPPSAELKPDQTDQDTLPPYDVLDPVLRFYVEEDRSVKEIAGLGYDEELVRRVVAMVDRAEYKRRQSPPGVKISPRACGKDRRLPITNRWMS